MKKVTFNCLDCGMDYTKEINDMEAEIHREMMNEDGKVEDVCPTCRKCEKIMGGEYDMFKL